MALFGSSNAYLGIDIGTSSLKIVELISRRRRIEVATYAEVDMPNILLDPPGAPEDAVRRLANILREMMEKANVATDQVVAALPNSIVFSTMLMLPDLPEKDRDDAVHFAARDIVPANLDDMILGWSWVGELPHMDKQAETGKSAEVSQTMPAAEKDASQKPVFMTAAPKNIVSRYTRLMELLNVELIALEVETFPLVRSVLGNDTASAMIIDIGDQITTFHIIDQGMPRLSHTIESGGRNITAAIATATQGNLEDAHALKVTHGLKNSAPEAAQAAMKKIVNVWTKQANRLLDLYADEYGRALKKTVLIGGGAKLQGLQQQWAQDTKQQVQIGDPWRGLSYPHELDRRMKELGPTYAVAVGLAQRGLH